MMGICYDMTENQERGERELKEYIAFIIYSIEQFKLLIKLLIKLLFHVF